MNKYRRGWSRREWNTVNARKEGTRKGKPNMGETSQKPKSTIKTVQREVYRYNTVKIR
jgi:hypothetical protein